MEFSALLELIANVLIDSQVTLRIPYYQRPYEWTEANVSALLNDIGEHIINERYNLIDAIGINHNRQQYLLGGIVLYKSQIQPGAHACHVIDGQQRLTTFTLICMALRMKIAEVLDVAFKEAAINTPELGWYQQNFVSKLEAAYRFPYNPIIGGSEFTPKLQIRLANYYEMAAKGMQDISAVHNSIVGRKYIANYTIAVSFFENLIGQDLNSRARLEKLCIYAGFLLNHVKVGVTTIATPIGHAEDHKSVIGIFCKLNARGKDLTASDILKVQLIAGLPNKQAETVAENWDSVFSEFESSEIDRFFSAIYPALKHSYPENYASAWSAYVNEVLPTQLTENLNTIIFPLARTAHTDFFNDNQHKAIISELESLNFSEWQSIVYCIRLGDLDANYLLKLKKLCFCFAMLGYIDSSRKRSIAEIFWAENEVSKHRFDEISNLAIRRLSEDDLYTLPAVRRNFVLKCIDRVLNNDVGGIWDYRLAHIEHVLPQNSEHWINIAGWTQDLIDKWTHKVGNLVYLNANTNTRIKNSGWLEKRSLIQDRVNNGTLNINAYGLRFSFDERRLNEIDWTPAEVRKRHKYIIQKVQEWLFQEN